MLVRLAPVSGMSSFQCSQRACWPAMLEVGARPSGATLMLAHARATRFAAACVEACSAPGQQWRGPRSRVRTRRGWDCSSRSADGAGGTGNGAYRAEAIVNAIGAALPRLRLVDAPLRARPGC